MKKLTTEEFIERARRVHGSKYDYSLSEYKNAHTKIEIICLEHGIFEQTPNGHLSKRGCPKCGIEKENKIKILKSKNNFIKGAKEIHGNKYNYSLVNYIGNRFKIKIICSKHGIFEQTPNSHLQGHGCFKCYGSIKSTTKEFIEKAKKIHENKYDYSKVEYINNKTKIKIICFIHGEFEQKPLNHLEGNGCPKCGIKKSGEEKILKTKNSFIKKSQKIHNKKYDYSKVNYIGNKNKIKIICPEHGEFEQLPFSHLRGHGCPKCANIIISNKIKSNTNDFIEKAKQVHNNKYNYCLIDYKNAITKVKIICPKHGEFQQEANSHLQGRGCPKCFLSTGEKIISKFLDENNIKYILQKKYNGCKFKRPLLFDSFLPDYNCCIEYDGIQHFKPIKRFGGEIGFKRTEKNDKIKNDYCKNNGIKLIRISYTMKNKIEKILKKEFDRKFSRTINYSRIFKLK